MQTDASPFKSGPQSESSASDRIYLDYHATTPVDPRVLEAMLPSLRDQFGNPASGQHAWGWAAEAAVTKARAQVAGLIGARAHEITFTSGATEGNNWAFFGLVHQIRAEERQAQGAEFKPSPIHILTSAVEHSSVMNAGRALQDLGIEVEFLPVNRYGQVDADQVARAIKPHTLLLSFIWANNEIGSLNPMKELGALAKERKIYLHSDGTQAVGKISVNVQEIGVDLLTFSAHKIYGPKGVGGMYLRSKDPHVQIKPYFYGGGHEQGLRSGSLNVPGIVGLGAAAELCANEMTTELSRTTQLRDHLIGRIQNEISDVKLNGHPSERSPINASLTFRGRPTHMAMSKLQKIGFSTGSACSAGRVSVSHVLSGVGLSEDDAACTLRLSVGRWSTLEEIDRAVEQLKKAFA